MSPDLELKVTTYDAADGVATVTLTRPERRNAFTGRMHHELRVCLATADADPAVRVAIVTGAAGAFSVGGDAEALAGHVERGGYDPGTPADMPTPGADDDPIFDGDMSWMMGLSVPVIAAVNGAAAGVALAIVCACDLRYAAADARMTAAHGPLNLPAEYGLSWILPRLVGLTAAQDLLLTSRIFTGAEGAELGLFHAAMPADEVLPHARRVAAEMIERVSPRSLAVTKRQLWLDQHREVHEAVVDANRLLDEMMGEADFGAGLAAWRERRPAEWTGDARPGPGRSG